MFGEIYSSNLSTKYISINHCLHCLEDAVWILSTKYLSTNHCCLHCLVGAVLLCKQQLLHGLDLGRGNKAAFTRRKERVSQNEEIKEAAISIITIPGRSRCARTEFKRERESQRAKKGAADPRKKSKLKVCSCYFFLISYFHFLFGFSLGIFLEFAFSGLLQSEVSVACRWSFRLFDRRSPLALPTLITQSATVSNFLP